VHLGFQPGVLGPGLLGVGEQVLGDLAQLGCIVIGLVLDDQGPQDAGIMTPGLVNA
jgi:hypothetical protein